MAKQTIAEIKAAIGYEAKPVVPSCSNCKSFSSDFITENKYGYGDWTTEKNLRCTFFHDRHFKVNKRGKCGNHKFKKD